MRIRELEEADLGAVAEIWNPLIRDSAVTFTSDEKTPEALSAWLAAGPPRLAAEEDGRLLGFACWGAFRGGPGYARIAEHTILLAGDARGRGVGRALMDALGGRARAEGLGSLVGGISGENAPAIAFHAALGFDEVGRLPRAGWKFGRWMDLVLMQKLL
ncbi:N-acetyltransferase family protein [Rhodovulum sp. DZ06]|uniref:GNAT family N-acetyltransferase n=1 Tax=Rhodovulum sp. DZ06 TaxID=3425126 RepID=UPI003D3443CC